MLLACSRTSQCTELGNIFVHCAYPSTHTHTNIYRFSHTFVSLLFIFYFILFYSFLASPHDLWDLSSPTRDWTHATAVKVPSPNHWTTREFLVSHFVNLFTFSDTYWYCWFQCNGTGFLLIFSFSTSVSPLSHSRKPGSLVTFGQSTMCNPNPSSPVVPSPARVSSSPRSAYDTGCRLPPWEPCSGSCSPFWGTLHPPRPLP